LLLSVTIAGCMLIPSPYESWVRTSAAQTVNDKKSSAAPR